MQALLVPPVHPSERGEFDVTDGAPRAGVGPVDALGFVEPVDRLGEGVVEAVADAADRRRGAELGKVFAVADAGDPGWQPRSE
jgi:hypothetical protein